jgi:hypothetical protein
MDVVDDKSCTTIEIQKGKEKEEKKASSDGGRSSIEQDNHLLDSSFSS